MQPRQPAAGEIYFLRYFQKIHICPIDNSAARVYYVKKEVSTLNPRVLIQDSGSAGASEKEGGFVMDLNQYTQKSLEALRSAQQLAATHQNQQLEQAHLLLALLRQDGGLVPQLLKRLGVTVESLDAAANDAVEKLPAVTGSGRSADQLYISGGMQQLLAAA